VVSSNQLTCKADMSSASRLLRSPSHKHLPTQIYPPSLRQPHQLRRHLHPILEKTTTSPRRHSSRLAIHFSSGRASLSRILKATDWN
jgi:hypothetical protein